MGTAEDDKVLLKEALLDAAQLDLDEDVDEPDALELQAYLAGELTEDQDEHVRAWLVATEGAGDRLLELASFVEATPPAADAPVAFEEEVSWRNFQRRIANSERASESETISDVAEPVEVLERPRASPVYRGWQAAAAVLALTTGLLLMRVFDLESERGLQNLRRLTLVGDTRGGAVERFPMVSKEPFLVEISPSSAPAGCETYGAELRGLDGKVLDVFEDLRLTDYILRFVVSGEPGQRLLVVSACGQTLDRFRVDLVTGRP